MRNKILFLLTLLIVACSSPQTNVEVATPTIPVFEALPVTDTPALPTETPLPTVTPVPALEKAIYTLDVLIDYDAKTVGVNQNILYPNLTGNQLNNLVIAIVPNLWQGSFNLTSISINGEAITNYLITNQRLDIPLSFFLAPNETVDIDIQYSLALPFAEQEDPSISRPRIYGYTSRQINLTNWYPFVVPNINGEWILHEPWYYGEHLVYDAADYAVTVRYANPDSAPIVASSGVPEIQADGSITYKINSARTFALSASRDFQTSTTQFGDVTLTSY
ncbi:MAG TPA: hypothetical protein PLX90_04800, partial [Anaerolineales bacterium]|nr:hypothetical protein [Anaerolineales bacterium]